MLPFPDTGLLEQSHRLLKLDFPKGDGPAGAQLVVGRLTASEHLSRDFEFNVELLSNSPQIELKDVLGKMVCVELAREDGSSRYFNGYVFDFRFTHNDGGLAHYEMVLLPWLAFLRNRHNNFLFHGLSVEEQTARIFSRFQWADWKTQNLQGDPRMTDAFQFGETDYNYVHRRWEALGWHYWYEHRPDGHTLMLSGDSTQSSPIDGLAMPWQGESGMVPCAIHRMSPERRVAPTLVAARSFDFKNPHPVGADAPTLNRQATPFPRPESRRVAGQLRCARCGTREGADAVADGGI